MHMNDKAEKLISDLAPEIDKKCREIKAARKEKLLSRLFVILCITAVTVPALLVFCGISLTALLVPVLFMSLSVILLLPVLLSARFGNGGSFNEQA